MADGERHGQDSQAEREGDTEDTDADGRAGSQHGTAAPAKDQPESADQLGTHAHTQDELMDPSSSNLDATTAQAQLLDEGLLV
jgi:hypothetical protein